MTQMMDLNIMGLTGMDSLDLANINGGGLWDAIVGWVVGKILDHPKDVIAGVAEGASAGSQEKGGIFFK